MDNEALEIINFFERRLMVKFGAKEKASGIWPGSGHSPMVLDGVLCEGVVEAGKLIWAGLTWPNGIKNTYKLKDGQWMRIK